MLTQLMLCVFVMLLGVSCAVFGQAATTATTAISEKDAADVAKFANVTLVRPDSPDAKKGRPQVCHVWISMDDANPKDQIIVWFDHKPDQKEIDDAHAAELARRAKDAERRAAIEKEATK